MRVVPGGTAVRAGAYVAPGVVIDAAAYVNVGAYVGEGTLIDSHALVGSCAQVGRRVHLSAGAMLGGVLEPVGALPVIVEDEVLVGGNCGVYEGTIVGRRAVLGSGVILTGSVTVYDVPRKTTYRRTGDQPLRIPEGAVVVPGSRRLHGPVRGAARPRALHAGHRQVPRREDGRGGRPRGRAALKPLSEGPPRRRHLRAVPRPLRRAAATSPDGREVGATRGLLRSLLALLASPDVTHVACAFDHVIESFRNALFDGYKTSAGVPRELLAQFTLAERVDPRAGHRGLVDGRVRGRRRAGHRRRAWADAPEVEQVVICTPDKDLAQCVRGTRVVMLDRRRRMLLDEAAVVAKFGVPAGVDSRLPGPGRRQLGRLPGPHRLGRRRRRPPSCRATGGWRTSRTTTAPGACRCAARPAWPRGCATAAPTPSSTAPWPACARTSP